MKKTIAIVCAMKSEAQPIIDKLSVTETENVYGFEINHSTLNGNNLLICKSGVGMVNMAGLVTFLAVKYSPDIILNYGIIGGYGDVHKGSLVIVDDCININTTQFTAAGKGAGISLERGRLVTFGENLDNAPVIYKSDEKLLALAQSVATADIIRGRLGSGDVWNREYDKIMVFHNKYGVCGEDMEGYAMYQSAARFGIPAISLKGVSNNEILAEAYDYSVMEKLTDFVWEFLKLL